jgi:hypothetical protein
MSLANDAGEKTRRLHRIGHAQLFEFELEILRQQFAKRTDFLDVITCSFLNASYNARQAQLLPDRSSFIGPTMLRGTRSHQFSNFVEGANSGAVVGSSPYLRWRGFFPK